MNISDAADHELAILEGVRNSGAAKPVRQRDLARAVGISLGMTNVILRKLAQKGWLTFRRINSRHIQYALTPAGMEEVARRGYRYLKRTVRNVVHYKDILEVFLEEVAARGFVGVALVGRSDFDFIIEHLCGQRGLSFSKAKEPPGDERIMVVYAEDAPPGSRRRAGRAVMLRDVLLGETTAAAIGEG